LRLDDPDVVRAEYATDERFRGRSVYAWAVYEGPDPREHALVALLEARPRRVLDAGCGTGEFAERAASVLGAEVVGVDQSERMVELTRARGLQAHLGDVQRLPFRDGEFDAASANWMLYHLSDLDRGLSEVARVLRSGGRLVALLNDAEHLREIWGRDEDDFATVCYEALKRRFERVDRRDVRGAATFATREALRGYLAAFETLHGRDETGRAEDLPVPLRVRCHNVVLVAETAA
jgi:SAM-dependent methyltransferase